MCCSCVVFVVFNVGFGVGDMVDYDIVWVGIKGYYFVFVFIGELEVSDVVYIKGYGRVVVVKCDEVEVLY